MRIVLASLLAVGCVVPGVGTSGDDDGTGGTGGAGGTGGTGGTGGSGMMQPPPPPPPVASGTYKLTSTIDLTIEALLPQSLFDIVVTLRDFEANPASALFDLAEDAGVPAVGTIRDALPSYVEDKLYGWINDYIAGITVDGTPVTSLAGEVVTLAETTLTQFAINSDMTINGSSVTHTLTGLDFNPAGIDALITWDVTWDDITTTTASFGATRTAASIGDHDFAIAYGEYAWRAMEQAFISHHGLGIYDTVMAAVNCEGLATSISQKCVSGFCVGHKTELQAICARGVEEVVERAYHKFAEQRFDMLHFAAGSATLVDADNDLDVEALAAGVWTAEINAGQGLRSVPATFTATR
jgi:hypothetical protein